MPNRIENRANQFYVTYRTGTGAVETRPAADAAAPFCLLGKRIFDVVVSLVVIVFFLTWLLPLLGLLIWLDSRGPVFFVQKRIGANGRIFRCFKLRTMVVNEEANWLQAKENDPRITTVGAFLRKTCLDELPQFVNVLMGDMSIVGPRPHMIRDCEVFAEVIPNYEVRHSVRPGITGMAQIKGFRGETTDYFDIAHRYKWDVFYVKNTSFILDLKIIHKTSLQTLSAMVKRPGYKAAPAVITEQSMADATVMN